MPRIAERLESHQVCAQHTLEDLVSSWKAPEELTAGKGDVEEEGYVYMWNALSEHAGKQKKVVVVDHDNISGLVDLQNSIRELQIHAVVVRPRFAFRPTIGRFMLFVVEEREELVFGEAFPSCLIFQEDISISILSIVSQPDGHSLASLIMSELSFKLLLIFLAYPQAFSLRRSGRSRGSVNRNGRRGLVQGRYDSGGCRRSYWRRRFFSYALYFSRPANQRMVPWCVLGGKKGKGVEESRGTTARLQFLFAVSEIPLHMRKVH